MNIIQDSLYSSEISFIQYYSHFERLLNETEREREKM